MRLTQCIVVAAIVVGGGVARGDAAPPWPVPRQSTAAANPLQADSDAIAAGSQLFAGRCASCHGLDAAGVTAPGLARLWRDGATDARLFEVVRRGVPSTEMPPFVGPDEDIWAILAYLRSRTAGSELALANDAEGGLRVFLTNCATCHRANGRGGRLGPDLSQIGSSSRAALIQKIRTGEPSMQVGYRPVTLGMRDGRRVRGLKKNEDAFTIQLMEMSERIQGYSKADVREMVEEPDSVMPRFGPDRLREADLEALLGYLQTLRGGPLDGTLISTGEVTHQNLLDGLTNPTRWLTYSGDYTSQRHSPLTQVTPRTCANSRLNGRSRPISRRRAEGSKRCRWAGNTC